MTPLENSKAKLWAWKLWLINRTTIISTGWVQQAIVIYKTTKFRGISCMNVFITTFTVRCICKPCDCLNQCLFMLLHHVNSQACNQHMQLWETFFLIHNLSIVLLLASFLPSQVHGDQDGSKQKPSPPVTLIARKINKLTCRKKWIPH